MLRRVVVERRFPGDPRIMHSSMPPLVTAQFSVDSRGSRIERDGLSVLVERLAGLVVELEDPAQQGVDNGRAGIEPDDRRECSERLVLTTQVPQIEGEVQVAGDPEGSRAMA
jgi:hypothetical protein